MINLKVHYKFDCGSGLMSLMNNKKINDNQWHVVTFIRDGKYGQLIVDEEEIEGYSEGNSTTIDVNPPFFVGGVLPQMSQTAYMNTVKISSLVFFSKSV